MKRVKYQLEPHQWVKHPTDKHYVVWHGTGKRTKFTPYAGQAGTPEDLINNWSHTGERYATPYIVDRDGTVYDVYPDSDWSFHLGIAGSRGHYCKQAVGIEIANELGLESKDGGFYAFGSTYHQNEYLGKAWKHSFKGYDFWAELNQPQVDSLIELTLEVCKRHKITPTFYNSESFNPKVWNQATIFRHINCNPNKIDLPLNDWVIDKIAAAGIKLVS